MSSSSPHQNGLDYETPPVRSAGNEDADPLGAERTMIRTVRRLCFAIGMGVLAYSIGVHDAGGMAIGAIMVGLCIPLGRLRGERD